MQLFKILSFRNPKYKRSKKAGNGGGGGGGGSDGSEGDSGYTTPSQVSIIDYFWMTICVPFCHFSCTYILTQLYTLTPPVGAVAVVVTHDDAQIISLYLIVRAHTCEDMFNSQAHLCFTHTFAHTVAVVVTYDDAQTIPC
jgi:hypothetical protein